MAGFETFERQLRVATQSLTQEGIADELAKFARAELAETIQRGEGTRRYDRFVNGRPNASEDSVIPPGPILYQFQMWDEVITFALVELVKRSPKKSGRYSRSFVVISRGRVVTSWDQLNSTDEVIIFNAQPYTRKIEVGAMRMTVGPWHFEGATAALRRKFGANGSFRFENRFLNIGAGVHSLVPYRLRRGGKRRRAGDLLTYPAIIMNMV